MPFETCLWGWQLVKAKLVGENGEETLYLGVTFENLKRMREGDPIVVRGSELQVPFDIVIHVEKDEAAHLEKLKVPRSKSSNG